MRLFSIVATVSVTSAAGVALVVGCSHDSSSGTSATTDSGSTSSSGGSSSGGSSSGGGSSGTSSSSSGSSSGSLDAGSEAAPDDPTPGVVVCGAASCDAGTGDFCCRRSTTNTCHPFGDDCDGGFANDCDEAADCMAGSVCCFENLAAGSISECTTHGCPTNRVQACRTQAECDGGICEDVTCSSNSGPVVLRTCGGICP